MSAPDDHEVIQVGEPLPTIMSVEVVGDYRVKITWAELVPVREDEVDLGPVIHKYKYYKPLRDNPDHFKDVRVAEGRNAIAWPDEVDMSALLLDTLVKNG